MASKSGRTRPWPLLALFGVIVAVLYLLVFFTGDKKPTPRLGIDLSGGTSVTLTARTPDGSSPSSNSLKQARQIIDQRVNGLGVSGAEVVIEGDNIVITVPGDDSGQARALGQTAQLFIRPVITSQPAGTSMAEDALTADEAADDTAELAEGEEGEETGADTEAGQDGEGASGEVDRTGMSAEERAEATRQEIEAAQEVRQSADPEVQARAMSEMDCTVPDPLQGNDDPDRPLVACDAEGENVYLLDAQLINGQQIADAEGLYNPDRGENIVQIDFKSDASRDWSVFTREHALDLGGDGQQAAFVLDTEVLSAPQIVGHTPEGSSTSVTGQFKLSEAKELANQLKYGSLPLSFEQSDARTVSQTLGSDSLKYGLIAGLVGLILVLIYSLIYYRALGVLIILSLILSGALVFPFLVLLGRSIGYSLNLAGIAGLIIGIGTTADSFIVYFERIKDEIREGRSFRSSVPRAWARARRTILSGNMVSFIGAAVLYFLAIGDVRGFAFTLGLTTLLDLVVVFLVTHPLVYWMSTWKWASNPKWNGLGAMQDVARERRAAAEAAYAAAQKEG